MQSALRPMHFALLNFLGQCKLHYGQCSLHCSFFWANANCILGNVVCIGFFWLYSRKHTNNMHVCNVFIMGLLWLPNVFDHIREFACNVSLLLVLAFHVHQGCLQYGFIHGSCVSCAWRLIATCFFIVMALAFACIAFTEFLNMTRSFWFSCGRMVLGSQLVCMEFLHVSIHCWDAFFSSHCTSQSSCVLSCI